MSLVSFKEAARRFRSNVLPSEWAVLAYCCGAMILIGLFHARVPRWGAYVAGHLALVVGAALLVGRSSRILRFLRDFDLVVHVTAIFFMNCLLVHLIHPVDYDDMLIRWDRALGGLKLLKAMESITLPWLTDLAKLSWVAYYAIPLFPGIPLYRRAGRESFREAKLVYALGYLLTYVGYFAMPAQGPGYFSAELGIDQPRWEESAVAAQTKEAITWLEGDARDTFPSGHVTIAALTIFLLARHRLWTVSLVGVPVSLLVAFSTIYLRYHYLSDVLAGIALATLCAFAGCAWHRRALEQNPPA